MGWSLSKNVERAYQQRFKEAFLQGDIQSLEAIRAELLATPNLTMGLENKSDFEHRINTLEQAIDQFQHDQTPLKQAIGYYDDAFINSLLPSIVNNYKKLFQEHSMLPLIAQLSQLVKEGKELVDNANVVKQSPNVTTSPPRNGQKQYATMPTQSGNLDHKAKVKTAQSLDSVNYSGKPTVSTRKRLPRAKKSRDKTQHSALITPQNPPLSAKELKIYHKLDAQIASAVSELNKIDTTLNSNQKLSSSQYKRTNKDFENLNQKVESLRSQLLNFIGARKGNPLPIERELKDKFTSLANDYQALQVKWQQASQSAPKKPSRSNQAHSNSQAKLGQAFKTISQYLEHHKNYLKKPRMLSCFFASPQSKIALIASAQDIINNNGQKNDKEKVKTLKALFENRRELIDSQRCRFFAPDKTNTRQLVDKVLLLLKPHTNEVAPSFNYKSG